MTVIFDSGHGGMVGGVYQTAGKRSPSEWAYGTLYEGAFNRWIKNDLKEMCDRLGVAYYDVSCSDKDTPLWLRVKRANEIYKRDNDVFLLSIHANAGGGEGFEAFTSRGNTVSDSIAERFYRAFEADGHRVRKDFLDGDSDKESDFYVLKYTKCPAVLLELAFMDSKIDYNRLWSKAWRSRVSKLIFNVITDLVEV